LELAGDSTRATEGPFVSKELLLLQPPSPTKESIANARERKRSIQFFLDENNSSCQKGNSISDCQPSPTCDNPIYPENCQSQSMDLVCAEDQ
jgi:hypothetical protein